VYSIIVEYIRSVDGLEVLAVVSVIIFMEVKLYYFEVTILDVAVVLLNLAMVPKNNQQLLVF